MIYEAALLCLHVIHCFRVDRWQKLLADSDSRKQRLLRLQDQYRQVEDLYLTFAKKASAFNSWFENAEEDLTDPVRCNSVEEILVGSGGCVVLQVDSCNPFVCDTN